MNKMIDHKNGTWFNKYSQQQFHKIWKATINLLKNHLLKIKKTYFWKRYLGTSIL